MKSSQDPFLPSFFFPRMCDLILFLNFPPWVIQASQASQPSEASDRLFPHIIIVPDAPKF